MTDGNGKRADTTCLGARTCIVVTIHEQLSMHSDEVDTMAFSDWDRAEAWIESQIDSHVAAFGLDRETDVAGRLVHLDGDAHTIQYDAKKRDIL